MANKSNRFLQGPYTEQQALGELRDAISKQTFASIRVVNYTKDGVPFYNRIDCYPLRDSTGEVTHFCAVLDGQPVPEGTIPKLEREVEPPAEYIADEDSEEELMGAVPLASNLLDARPPAWTASTASSEDGTTPPSLSSVGTAPIAAAPISASNVKLTKNEGIAPTTHSNKRQRCRTTLADALQNTSDAVVMTEPTPPYAITHVNGLWEDMCGYTHEEVEGLTSSVLQGPDTDQMLLAEMMAMVSDGKTAEGEIVNYKKDGTRFINHLSIEPIFNEKSELEQFMAILREMPDS